MLHSKSYSRKTKKGSVIKVVKEHYLRDDIACGLVCTSCPEQPGEQKHLNANYFVIPDTNILYHQIDLMEHSSITNIICLQTVLEELRNRSSAIYNRVRELISNQDKNWYVFSNEHHRY